MQLGKRTVASKIVLFVGIGVLLAGCVTGPVKQAEKLNTTVVPETQNSLPIALTKVVYRVPRTKPLGGVGVGLFCVEQGKITVSSGRYQLGDYSFSHAFRDVMERANYTVVGDPDALFQDTSINKARYLIAGLVTDMRANVCYPMAGYGNSYDGNGSLYMKVEWQIQDALRRKVVYKTTSEGSASFDTSTPAVMDLMLDDAFAMASENLLADQGFFNLMTGKAQTQGASDQPELMVKNLSFQTSESFDPVKVRPGVVTIKTPTGHGSGFFISPEGFILTNNHVISGANTVRIRLHSGREIAAEVLRTDSRRDVALLKAADEGFTALPLSFAEPAVGSTVLAYGTPQYEFLEGSLTRGILSAYRVQDDLRYIQSDVNIRGGNSGGPMMDENGNVIAITVAGFVDGNSNSIGHNLFIPLREAFDVMRIRQAPKPSS